MGTLFDSSVLIAAFVEAHPKHKEAPLWLRRAKNNEIRYVVAAHSLTEVYSVLTSAPFKPPFTPKTARKLIDKNISESADIISLSGREYLRMINMMSQAGLKGGIVYDAIIVECARKSKSDQIITLNLKDFLRLTSDDSIKIISL